MRKESLIIFSCTVFVSGFVYALTLCPTVEFIDSGESAMACKYLGIAHPTGYPLYTLLGNLAAKIPLGSLIIRENILSLLLTAIASGFLFLFISRILQRQVDTLTDKLAAALVAVFTALTPVWWSQGTTNEVYSLNLLLIPLALWSLFNYSMSEKGNFRWLALSAYSLGLCLANHLSVIYVIPGMIYMLLVEIQRRRFAWKELWALALFLLFPLTLYLFLPIRAQFKPFLNWGNVSDPYFFYKHVTGWQYRVWMFSDPLGIFKNLPERIGPAANLIYDQFKWYGLLPALIGVVITWFRFRKYLIFTILIWLANLVYVLNYDIADIEAYYLPMIIMTSVLIALVATEGMRLFARMRRPLLSYAILGILLVLVAANSLVNFNKNDRSRKTLARQGVLDIAQSIEPDGVAFVDNWDFYSPWLYMRFEENFRPDMFFLGKELMRRSWYIDFIRRNQPDIFERSRPAFEEFLTRVEAYDRGQQYNPYVLDEAFYGMFDAIIRNEIPYRPVYTNVFGDKTLIKNRPLIPCGIMFRFDDPNIFHPYPRFEYADSIWGDTSIYMDARVGYLLSFYGRAFESRQKYCGYFGQSAEALYYAELREKVKAIMEGIDKKGLMPHQQSK